MSHSRQVDATFELGELARLLDAELVGDASLRIRRVRPLESAGESDLSFLTSSQYRDKAVASRASALLIGNETDRTGLCDNLLVCDEPYLALARLLQHLHPEVRPAPGVHETAIVSESADVDGSATLGPYVVVGENTVVAAGAVLWSHVTVGRGCFIGRSAQLHPHVAVYDRTVVEDGCVVHSGAVLGADGFGYADSAGAKVKLPQVGRVVLESDVEVGANSAIDRATLDETRIGRGTKIDNLVQVGHNVVTGRGCILCGQAGISGSTILGDHVVMGGQTGATGHLRIGDGVQVAAKTAIFQDVEAGLVVAGIPARPIASWRRQVALLRRLGELRSRLRRLEKRFEVDDEMISSDREGGKDE